MGNKTRNQIIEETVHVKEKGYANLKNDSGGETMWGITEGTARKCKYLWAKYGFNGNMRDMPIEMAYEIYAIRYWDEQSLDLVLEVSDKVAEELFDTGVNIGTHYPQTWLQRSLNVLNGQGKYYADLKVDGDIGPATSKALKAFHKRRGSEGLAILYSMLNGFQSVYYTELAERKETQEDFVYGWQRARVFEDLKAFFK